MDTGQTGVAGSPVEPQSVLGLPDTKVTVALQGITRCELRAADLSVTCIEGMLGGSISYPSHGPAIFSLTLVLDAKGRTRIESIEPLELTGGMAVLFWSDREVSGIDEIDGDNPIRAVEVRLQPEHLVELVGNVSAKLKNSLLTDRSDPGSGTLLIGFPLSAPLGQVANDVLTCSLADGELRRIYMRGKALEALALAMDTVARLPPALRLTQRDRAAIAEARRLIDNSPGEPWTIVSLAVAVGLSESKLKIGFREIVGISTRVYLRQVRIERAAGMIADGDPVTEAALATGFQNLSHFSKAFRLVKGMGPRQFASSHRRRTPV